MYILLWLFDADGNMFISGMFLRDIEIGNYKFSSSFNKQDRNGIYKQEGSGFFVARFDADGKIKWANFSDGKGLKGAFVFNVGGMLYISNGRIKLDNNKNVYISGGFADSLIFSANKTLVSDGSMDGFIAKYDSTGKFIWAKQAGGPFDDIVTELAFKNDVEFCAVISTKLTLIMFP